MSVYLRVDPRLMHEVRHPATEFKGAVKLFQRRCRDERLLAALDREREHVGAWLEDWQLVGQGLVVFSCRPAGILERHVVHVPVPTFVEVDC